MKKTAVILLRLVMIVGGAYFFYLFVAPIFGIIFNIGSVLGAFLSLFVFLFGVFFNRITDLIKRGFKIKGLRWVLGAVISVVAVCCISLAGAVAGCVAYSGSNTNSQDTLIVLGCSVLDDNPSITLNSRIQSAYDYLEANPQSVAVLSGGQGKDENISEAQCMFNVLTKKGIAPERLYLEDKSVSNREANLIAR